MNKYTELSDFEINKKVAEKLLIPHYVIKDKVLNAGSDSVYDPCNNAEQAWEIMLKYNICVIKELRNDFSAYKDLIVGYGYCEASYSYGCYHKNPFAAAMLVFLLMKDAENEG